DVAAGNVHRAVGLFGAPDTLRSRSGQEFPARSDLPRAVTSALRDADLALARACLAATDFTAGWDAGMSLSVEHAIEDVLEDKHCPVEQTGALSENHPARGSIVGPAD